MGLKDLRDLVCEDTLSVVSVYVSLPGAWVQDNQGCN